MSRHLSADECDDAFAEAAEKVRAAVEPADDVHASSSYRRHLAGVMAKRALEMARTRAGAH
jgi:CO/xanthine dehydrogenase FAD-binding subunit